MPLAPALQAFIAGLGALFKSQPDLQFERDGPIAYANSPTIVQWKANVKGTGALMTATFASNTKLSKIKGLKVEPLADAGFLGPAAAYLKGGAP